MSKKQGKYLESKSHSTWVGKVFITFAILLVGSIGTYFLLVNQISDEAKDVINSIATLTDVSLDSSSELQSINKKYEQLSEEDKADIENYDMLLAANKQYRELVCADLDRRMGEACLYVDSSSLPLLEALASEYTTLNDEEKEDISNFVKLEMAISESKKLLAEDVTEQILDLANGATYTAKTTLEEHSSIMTEKQIEECLIEIGRWEAATEAETYLKQFLKNPRSYTRYSGKCSMPLSQGNNSYKVTVTLNYGAENSFGASVRNDVEIYVYYRLSPSTASISFTKAELTPYYQWKFVS